MPALPPVSFAWQVLHYLQRAPDQVTVLALMLDQLFALLNAIDALNQIQVISDSEDIQVACNLLDSMRNVLPRARGRLTEAEYRVGLLFRQTGGCGSE